MHLSANTTFLKIVPVNPTIVKGFRKHNPIHFCVIFICRSLLRSFLIMCPRGIFCWLFERIPVTNANKRLRGVPENLNVLE